MDAMIRKALMLSLKLEFFYKETDRVIEPHTYGRLLNGKDAICGWQLSGGSGKSFRLFILEEMSELSLGENFEGSRQGYRRGDQQFRIIYAEL